MSCCKCGKESYISIANVGEFCSDCYNEWAAEKHGIVEDYDCPEQYKVYDDTEERTRIFELKHLNFGRCTSWRATEIAEGYDIEHISYPGQHPGRVVKEFLEKIEAAVNTKTLSEDGSLKMKGNLKVLWSEKDGTAFLIDGKEISVSKFGKMISNYEGWQIRYNITDASRSVLKKDELLLPITVGEEALLEELERNINVMADGFNFIKYSDTSAFELLFDNIYQKLDLMLDSEDYREEGISAVKQIITRLENLETDDDWFPRNLIDSLNELLIYR